MNTDSSETIDEELPNVGSAELFRCVFVLSLIIVGSVFAFVRKPIFPFATYPMFSRLHTDDFEWCRMLGLVQDAGTVDEAAEIDISDQEFWGFQMHIGRKVIATNSLINRPETTPEEIETAMNFLRDLYNKRGEAGLHDGPPIRRLRMYRHYWKVRPDLSNLDEPYHRDLVAESSITRLP